MRTKQLGNSDLEITPLGVGAWAIGGGGWAFGWGPQDDNESVDAIRAALDAGMNWIDTAAVYGLGHSEEIVAKALDGVSKKPYVFTKCARIWNEKGEIGKSLKADSIRREVEASLRRLKVDVIDLYQVHWPEPDEDVEEGWTTMAELQREGKVRWIGVSNFSAEQMKRAQAIAPITSLQPPYSLVQREIEESILPHAATTNVGVIVYSPMKNGLLSGRMTKSRVENFPEDDFRRRSPYFQEPRLTATLSLVEDLGEIAEKYGCSVGEISISWALRHPAVTAAIVGLRNRGQLDGVVKSATLELEPGDFQRIEDLLAKHGL
ncbi:MAG: aldo/keto reductase [Acidobacteria bacterium]|nr:aldo/keto reductase [Acidobacteriota bacterium]